MPNRRMVSLALVLVLAVPWSAAMSVVGLRVMFGQFDAPGLSDRGVAIAVGISALACGQLVFMMCACDRVFPRAARRIVVPAESLAAVLFLGGMAAACVQVLA